MPVNKFDTPAQAQFINTYTPIPFEAMQQAVALRQSKMDENLARLDQARAAADQLKYISNTEDEKYIKGTVLPAMDRITQEYAMQDLSDPTVYNAMRSDLRTSFDRNLVNDIQDSYGAWQQNEQIKAKLRATGKYHEALDLGDPSRDPKFSSASGVYNYQTEAMADVRKAAEQYFNNLKADTGFDPNSGIISSGISSNKIAKAAKENLRSFMDTKEGEQAVRLAAYRMGADYDKLSREEKEAAAMDVLMEVGDEFGYTSQTPMPGYASMMQQNQPPVNPWISPSDATVSTKVADNKKLNLDKDSSDFKSAVTRIGGVPAINLKSIEEGITGDRVSPSSKADTRTRANDRIIAEMERWQNDLPPETSKEDFVDVYNTALNSINNVALGVKYISSEISDQVKGEIISGMNLRNFKIMDGHGTSELGKLEGEGRKEGILKTFGKTIDELKEDIANAPQLFLTQDGPEAGMYGVEIKEKGKNGKLRTLWVGSNSNVQGMTNVSNQMNQRIRDLDETPLVLGIGASGKPIAIRAVHNLNYTDKKFDHKIEQGYIDEVTGNFVSTGIYKTKLPNGMPVEGMDAIKQLELFQLANSGVIGTNINYNKLSNIADKTFSPNP